ncbi:MAG: hypothetical protein HY294_09815 [Candidatus Rokubacteria bacterium]|nr:hypothetical protein [Candidatus Rokubacteria bacterium]MBI3826281.1 hypothetical protein [Candidatus Rokubacteria bacterium]
MVKITTEAEQHQRFRACAADHGLRLHRIHLLSATKSGSFQSSVVFDCTCGERWLMRVLQGDLVPVDGALLNELRQGRQGQATAPPGHPGAPDPQ